MTKEQLVERRCNNTYVRVPAKSGQRAVLDGCEKPDGHEGDCGPLELVEHARPVGCPEALYAGLTPEQGLQVTRAFFAGMSLARADVESPTPQDRLPLIASIMKKLLPPALLTEVLSYLDPLGTFVKSLRNLDANLPAEDLRESLSWALANLSVYVKKQQQSDAFLEKFRRAEVLIGEGTNLLETQHKSMNLITRAELIARDIENQRDRLMTACISSDGWPRMIRELAVALGERKPS